MHSKIALLSLFMLAATITGCGDNNKGSRHDLNMHPWRICRRSNCAAGGEGLPVCRR
jgi:hypothetical protein